MCDICLQIPCNTQCPESEEFEAIYYCSLCKEEIFTGDEYLETDKIICSTCVYDFTTPELIKYLGYELKEAF